MQRGGSRFRLTTKVKISRCSRSMKARLTNNSRCIRNRRCHPRQTSMGMGKIPCSSSQSNNIRQLISSSWALVSSQLSLLLRTKCYSASSRSISSSYSSSMNRSVKYSYLRISSSNIKSRYLRSGNNSNSRYLIPILISDCRSLYSLLSTINSSMLGSIGECMIRP